MTGIDRRSLLAGGAALIVTFSLPRRAAASVRTVAADSVDGYLSVAPDGAVAVFAGMVDLGTGARAALRQMVAEELGLSPDRITLVEGDTALTPDQGSTGGSRRWISRCGGWSEPGPGCGHSRWTAAWHSAGTARPRASSGVWARVAMASRPRLRRESWWPT